MAFREVYRGCTGVYVEMYGVKCHSLQLVTVYCTPVHPIYTIRLLYIYIYNIGFLFLKIRFWGVQGVHLNVNY